MKRKVAILTLLAVFLLAGYATATGKYKTIKVLMDKVDLKMNGQPSGAELEVLSYNGSIYIPIRKVGEAFGGDVTWDSVERSVDIDFVKIAGDKVVGASNSALYQFMLMEKNQIMEKFITLIQKKNYAGMKPEIERLHFLERQANNIGEEKLENLLAQLAFSADVISESLQSNSGKDYELAVKLFLKSEADYTSYLQGLLLTQ